MVNKRHILTEFDSELMTMAKVAINSYVEALYHSGIRDVNIEIELVGTIKDKLKELGGH